MLKTIKNNIQNIPGKRLSRKLVVFESDDWGSIRIPSKKVMHQLADAGIAVHSNPFNYLDALETETDLVSLFELLAQFKDHQGNHPVITANCIVANPDFEQIKKDQFETYHWESVIDSYQKNPGSTKAYQAFKDGMAAGVIWPQFHGREHVNIHQWLTSLQNKTPEILKAFELGVFGIDFKNNLSLRNNFMAAFDFNSPAESAAKRQIVKEGLEEFERIYGMRSRSFIAPCYVWHRDLEPVLNENGVKYLQGINYQFSPEIGKDQYRRILHTQGQKNETGQRYFFRNAFFEPSLNRNFNWVDDCMKRINTAFFWGKPAIIGTHRINFTGAIDEDNRIKNHELLKLLLANITNTWKDVEFITSDRLGDLY